MRAHDGRAHLAGLSLGAQVGVAVMAVAARLVGRAVFSGASVRPIPGVADLIGPSLWLYAPFKNLDFLIRANQRSLGVPAEYAAEFAADTRRATAAGLAAILKASLTFAAPPA